MQKKIGTDNNDTKYYKVSTDCHYTGKYKGAAHNVCNLRYQTLNEIPVIFHNDSKYDYHFIINELEEKFKENLNVQD